MDRVDLLAHFLPGFTPRREQARLLASLADAIAESLDDPAAPRVFVVEAPPGVGKSHVAMALAHWSGDAYLLTSQKLLQDQYEREFGADLQLVKGRDNYRCERYADEPVPTPRGMCRRPRARLDDAEDYRNLLGGHLERMEGQLESLDRALAGLRPAFVSPEHFLSMPPSRAEQELLAERETLEAALARIRFFVDAEDREWVVRYPPEPGATLELVPLTVTSMARDLLTESAELVVLSSAYLGHRSALAESLGLDEAAVRSFSSESPFPLAKRRIEYRPVGALAKATLTRLEPALFAQVAAILAEHPREKGLIHAPSYAAGRRLVADLAGRGPAFSRRLIWVESAQAKTRALDQHRAAATPTVLVSPSLREGVDLPDDFLRFQVVTKMPYPDLGDPWTAARQSRDPRWYALETAKALVQAYGRSCRHADDHGLTYVLDRQFERFLAHYRALLPPWFLDAVRAAMRARYPEASSEGEDSS